MALFDNCRCVLLVLCFVTSLVGLCDAAPSVRVEQPSATACPKYRISCDNGQCIDKDNWCNGVQECDDESDEKYCRGGISFWDKDPNNCKENGHFKCQNYNCVPLANKCDGYNHCKDASDEDGCVKESSEENDSSEENGEGSKSNVIEQEQTDEPDIQVSPETDADDAIENDVSNEEEEKFQIHTQCPHTPVPCVQPQCQYDFTTCPHIQTLCSQLQMICSGRLSPWPCPNPCVQNSNSQVQTPCVPNSNPCPQVQTPCVPTQIGGSGSSTNAKNPTPCPHVPAPPNATPCPQSHTTPCPHVHNPPITTPCPHVNKPGKPPSIPCPTQTSPCPHTPSTTQATTTRSTTTRSTTTRSTTTRSTTTRSTTTQRPYPQRRTPPSSINPFIKAITQLTRTVTTTPVQCPFTTTTKNHKPPPRRCPNAPPTQCPHQPSTQCPIGHNHNCPNSCHNHNPHSCPHAGNPCDPGYNSCNPGCNPCNPGCNPCEPGPEPPTEPPPTPPCVTPPGPCSHVKERSFTFPESEYEDYQFIYHDQLVKAKKWLMDIRSKNYDWEAATPRGLVALSLLDQKLFSDFDSVDNGLMKRAFLVKLATEKELTSRDYKERLAQYLNAMLATNQNPRDFRGEDLVKVLQKNVEEDLKENRPINPFVSLSMCLAAGYSGETGKFPYHAVEWLNPPSYEHKYQDMMSFAIMTLACYGNDPAANINYQKDIDGAVERLLKRMNTDGSFGSKYSTALAAQALLSVKTHGNWDATKTLDFLANQQVEDGSFGNLMATYYIVPALAGKSLLHLVNTVCEYIEPTETDTPMPEITTTPIPITRTIAIQLSLFTGNNENNPLSTVHLNMPKGSNLLEAMEEASQMNSYFRFRYDVINEKVLIYSISGIPNDAERHHYWNLYIQDDPYSTARLFSEDMIYDSGGINMIYLTDENIIVFHYEKN